MVGGDTDEGGKHPGKCPRCFAFSGRGAGGEMLQVHYARDERTAYPESSRRSEQLSCTKFFDPSYGLPYINFKRFKSFLGFI